jgi:predicted transposase/invertase (TIGR01784 family)
VETALDVRVDFAFKKVFSTENAKHLPMALINAITGFAPSQRVLSLKLLNPFSEIDFVGEKLNILDIMAKDQQFRLFDIEMQLWTQRFFLERSGLYVSKYYSQQLGEGEDYNKLRPIHGIFILNWTQFPEDRDYYRHVTMTNVQTGARLNDHLNMHFIELPKFKMKTEEVKTPREIWTYFIKHSTTLDPNNLPISFAIEPIREALEMLKMLSQNPLEARQYAIQKRAIVDREMQIEYAQQQGLEKGELLGLEKGELLGLEKGELLGLKKGEVIGKIEFAQRMLREPATPRAELESCSVDELQSRLAVLEARAFPAS